MLTSGAPAVLLRIIFTLLLGTFVLGCKPPPNTGTAKPVQSSGGSAAGAAVGPARVIPVGRIAADVMQFGQSQRVMDLHKKKQDAIRQDPQWYFEQRRQQKSGEPEAYDTRLGLTPEEFQELQSPQSKKTSTRKMADATITISDKGNSVYAIDGGQSLPDLTGIEIDLKNDVVRTPFGVTGNHKDLTMPDDNPVGGWTGVRWGFGTAGAGKETETTFSLAIGRLKSSGRGILIYYLSNPAAPPEEKKRVNVMLNYDLPPQ